MYDALSRVHDADDGSPEHEEAAIAYLSILLECLKRAAKRAPARSGTTAHSWSMRARFNWAQAALQNVRPATSVTLSSAARHIRQLDN